MVTSLNNELISMLSTGEFLYVYSWKWEARALPDIWIRFHVEPNLCSRVESTPSQAMCVLNASTGYRGILLTVLEACQQKSWDVALRNA